MVGEYGPGKFYSITNGVQRKLMLSQPLSVFEHPDFKSMMDVAAQATNGVKLPGRKLTRQSVIDMFKVQMIKLRTQLQVLT